jgi:hypothetical protein
MLAPLGPLVGFAALFLWVLGAPIARLDALVAALYAVGAALSALAWLRGTPEARRLAVVGIGLNAAGLIALVWLS